MIVCSCNILSDKQVRAVVETEDAPRKVSEIYNCLGCSPQCGRCARTIREIMRSAGGCCSGHSDDALARAVLSGEA
jgi:bacterioferritin-associated ferredoxin